MRRSVLIRRVGELPAPAQQRSESVERETLALEAELEALARGERPPVDPRRAAEIEEFKRRRPELHAWMLGELGRLAGQRNEGEPAQRASGVDGESPVSCDRRETDDTGGHTT